MDTGYRVRKTIEDSPIHTHVCTRDRLSETWRVGYQGRKGVRTANIDGSTRTILKKLTLTTVGLIAGICLLGSMSNRSPYTVPMETTQAKRIEFVPMIKPIPCIDKVESKKVLTNRGDCSFQKPITGK